MTTFTAGLAHEIKNPLNSASIQLQLLERNLLKTASQPSQPLTDQCLEITGRVRHEIGRLNLLIEDFLLFARPYDLHPQREDLGLLLDQCIEKVQLQADEAQVQFERDYEAGQVSVEVDEEKIQQAFVNLLSNAIEAMPGGGTLIIQVGTCKDHSCIVFSDSGPGIPDSIKPQIFDVFFSTKEIGTGLGLPIACRIIEEHGGSLKLESTSTPGGTVFAATLPFA